MASLDTRFYLTADCGSRVECSTHPDTGLRVWSCPCGASGHDDGAARTHAAECRPTNPGVGILPRHHFS